MALPSASRQGLLDVPQAGGKLVGIDRVLA
jgi:hypothetical protein